MLNNDLNLHYEQQKIRTTRLLNEAHQAQLAPQSQPLWQRIAIRRIAQFLIASGQKLQTLAPNDTPTYLPTEWERQS
ncbi:MAG: hypothetical protein MUF87_17360 [Anaerolineae bacterium]|jgi:hypothetical protein|nr:hypothetical protein [Anaerolineae bacterium]